MKKSLILLGLISTGFAYAQHEGKIGINTETPKATLEIIPNTENRLENATTNEGIIIPKLSKLRIANIENNKLVEGTLVYATDNVYTGTNTKVSRINEKGYYFYNGTEWEKMSTKNAMPIRIETTNTTITPADNGGYVYINSTAPNSVTIPTTLPIGFSCVIVQLGTGVVNLSGITLESSRGIKTRTQYSAIGIIKRADNVVTVTGDAIF